MSGQLSPDGIYYWDGYRWVSTLSPDGRYRWNGSAWLPVQTVFIPTPTPKVVREPTSWTRPLQYTVAAWYAISALDALTVPIWMNGLMSQMFTQAFQRQQDLNPGAVPPPPGFIDAMTSMMTGILWVSALFGAGISVLFIVSALKRWNWAYYAVLAWLGLGVLSGPSNLIGLLGGNLSVGSTFTFPTWIYALGLALSIPSTALFIWMLVALIKRGPWAMRRVTPAGSPAG